MAKGSKKKAGNSKKSYYDAYKTRAAKQRQKRLERHQKAHPNDKQGGSTSYRRKTPLNESGWLTAQMDSKLTPSQLTPITLKDENGKRQQMIPECAEHLKDMTKAERKKFAQLYSRVRKLHNHPRDKKKGGK